jgi:hypothetical protein
VPAVVANPLSMNISQPPLSSPIEEKIAWAEDCYERFGSKFLTDRTISELLNRLKRAVRNSRQEMTAVGIDDICSECERYEGGSCCGRGIENKCDGWLLLINLLLNVRLPKKRYDPESCFFLGKAGCILLARHVICVNYICKRITDRIDPRTISTLRKKEGEELNTLFLLHENVKKYVV